MKKPKKIYKFIGKYTYSKKKKSQIFIEKKTKKKREKNRRRKKNRKIKSPNPPHFYNAFVFESRT